MDQYLHHLRDIKPYLNADETYLCVDGFFSKKKFINGVTNRHLHQIGRLRRDANCRYLYTGPKREKGSGNQKTYDGKVDWQDLSRFTYHHTQDGIASYSQILNHQCFKRNLKVVVLVNEKIKKNYVILFSTDQHLDAQSVVTYYKARSQIEFIFRDAKQFTGLSDAQTRDKKCLDFHFNASLTTLNLSKAEHLKTHWDTPTKPFSMTSIKACYFNTFFLEKFFSMFDLDPKHIKKSPQYTYLINYGNIAA
ncbi:MAG: transposase [Candidatus Latescibacteria bacterium]|nr:transposase [Candidatus Latescibacterota bacterium]